MTNLTKLSSTQVKHAGRPLKDILDDFGADTSGQPFSFRNKIINGDCRVTQRGSVSILNSTSQYGAVDRHFANLSATTVTAGTFGSTGMTSSSNLGCAILGASATGVTSGGIGQRIESLNSTCLNGKTVTFSCLVWHDFGSATNISLRLFRANTKDTFPADFTGITQIGSSATSSVAHSTLTKLTATWTLGQTDASNGLCVFIAFNTGALTNKNFVVGDLQLEEGSIATPFEHRPYGTELALCQRYYYKIAGSNYGAMYANTGFMYTVFFPVTMRSLPTVTKTVTSGTFSSEHLSVDKWQGYYTGTNIGSVSSFSANIEL